jgi:hypothetical protein
LTDKLEQIVAAYFSDLRDKRGLGAGTPERSYYPAVAALLDALGQQLKPKVLCLSDLSNTGAGQPDFGLYVANQVQRGEPKKGQAPERGVIEMKPVKDDAWLTADTKQVSKYWGAYRLVIVTNLRDFLILGEGPNGSVARLETFRLAKSEAAFWEMVGTPQKSAGQVGRAFGEYLSRVLTQYKALRDDLGVAEGLASDQVYILDPCCGTGTFLAAVLKRIDATLGESGFGALKGQMIKKAATTRIFGFEILPAPFVVAHCATTVPRVGRRTEESRQGKAGSPNPRHTWQSAIQRFCWHGCGGGAQPF